MNGKLLLDTNIILGLLKGKSTAVNFFNKHEGCDLYASVITRLELLSFHGLTQEDEEAIHDFLAVVTIVPLNSDVEETAILLRRVTRHKIPDTIIAASAIVSGTILVTNDRELAATKFPGLMVITSDTPVL